MRFVKVVLVFAMTGAVCAQTGVIRTVAGATALDGVPVRGFSGDGGPAIGAALALANIQNGCGDPGTFEQAVHLAVDSSGNLYVADGNNHRVRRVALDGVISTVSGSGPPQTNSRCEPTSAPGDDGPATAARLYNPASVAIHPNGDLIIADQQNNRIRRVAANGTISTIVGNGMHNPYAANNPATSSPMDWPSAVAVDSNGNIYFAEVHSNRIARVGSDGAIRTVAGALVGSTADGIPATSAQLRKPMGIAIDSAGNVYIADTGNHRIRKVGTDGIITTVAGRGQPGDDPDGMPATQSRLNTPMDVKVDRAGHIYIADTLNHKVKRVGTDGIITTIAGDGVRGRGAENVAARSSGLNTPAGLAIAPNGDLYIADWQNYLIRKVSFSTGPVISRILNGASFASGGLAPGTIITIAGALLASSTRAPSAVPFPTRMDDVTVEVNGTAVPLFYVAPDQINAQLPHDLAPGTATLRVRNATGVSVEETFQVAASSPGIFQLGDGGLAAALNQDNSVNHPENGARAGSVVSVFLTGLGMVVPPVASGSAAPLDVLSRALEPVSATVAGINAEVLFAGLTPGSVGLAQVNIVVPASTAPAHRVPLIIRVGEQVSNTVTIAVR
jgi:uncharacterized protein (TIGR03437 family)